MPYDSEIRSPTIRELGGEIWAELPNHLGKQNISADVKNKFVDIVMAVLARHSGKRIVNDADLPVVPLPSSRK